MTAQLKVITNCCYLYIFFKLLNSLLFLVCLYKIMYSELSPHGPLKLYHFIAMVTVIMICLSQFPSFHSLRHINLASLFLSLGYTFLVVGACIRAGKCLCSLWFTFFFMSSENVTIVQVENESSEINILRTLVYMQTWPEASKSISGANISYY